MKKKSRIKKIFHVIKKSVFLRIFGIMNIVLIILAVSALIGSSRLNGLIEKNSKIIEKNKTTLQQMERLIQLENMKAEGSENYKLFGSKSFASYEEVIPFMGLLEGVFANIDPDASISIMTPEDQISTTRYADYSIKIKINKKKELVIKAFEEMYNSRFITKIQSLSAQWKREIYENGQTGENELSELKFVVRLYLS